MSLVCPFDFHLIKIVIGTTKFFIFVFPQLHPLITSLQVSNRPGILFSSCMSYYVGCRRRPPDGTSFVCVVSFLSMLLYFLLLLGESFFFPEHMLHLVFNMYRQTKQKISLWFIILSVASFLTDFPK